MAGVKFSLDDLDPKYRRQALNQIGDTSTAPEPKRDTVDEPLAEDKAKAFNKRVDIHYHCKRRRLLDPDNACTKYFTDALRYCGILEDDTADCVRKIWDTQEKDKEEGLVITITEV